VRASLCLLILFSPLVASSALADNHPTKQQCIAANEEGQDLRRGGRVNDAVQRFETCAATACPAAVREDCLRRLAYARSIPTLVIDIKGSGGDTVSGAQVTMDGAALGPRVEGTTIHAEAGEHMFEITAAGYRSTSKKFVLRDGEKDRRELVVLELEPKPKTVAALTGSGEDRGDDGPKIAGVPQRTLAYVVGGAGALLLVVGGGVGLAAQSKYDDAVGSGSCDKPVNSQRRCTDAAITVGDSASTLAAISTAAFIVGGLLGATGIVLFATSPARAGVTSAAGSPRGLTLAVGLASARLGGAW